MIIFYCLLLAGQVTEAQDVDGIYPVQGGTGMLTIYGDDLDQVTDIRFRSELIQGINMVFHFFLLSLASHTRCGDKLFIIHRYIF